jgi:hypothetical protein
VHLDNDADDVDDVDDDDGGGISWQMFFWKSKAVTMIWMYRKNKNRRN